MADETSLKQFLDSTWFKGLARASMLVGTAAASYAGLTLAHVRNEQAAMQGEIADIVRTQADRAQDNERFQSAIGADIAQLKNSVSTLQVDVATMRGILQEMQRRDVASRVEPALRAGQGHGPEP
ncbi:MAG TPA: hypothetical protein VGM83_18925 [Devosiaceae bacterium]|jgi:TolA-binding protein